MLLKTADYMKQHKMAEPGAKLVLSGIIAPRKQQIREALVRYDFRFERTETENDWVAILATYAPKARS